MKDLKFPIDFKFNISTLANDFTATDASGRTVAYVKQKMFKLKEAITIYSDTSKTKVNYKIAADSWIDFSAAYNFTNNKGEDVGKVARKGFASLWKSKYEIIDQNQKLQYQIREDNAWVKFFDAFLGGIPVISIFTGYFFNPSYTVSDLNGQAIARLKKEPSFWGRKFKLEKLKSIDNDDDERIILSFMMMVLLERRKG